MKLRRVNIEMKFKRYEGGLWNEFILIMHRQLRLILP